MDTRTAMQLALKLRDAAPASDEGELVRAAWLRCVHAVAEHGGVGAHDRTAFLSVCGVAADEVD